MAKDTIQWGAADAPAEAIKWGADDAPVQFGEADAPVDQPVSAPPAATRASDAEIDSLAQTQAQQDAAAGRVADTPRRSSVLEGVQMPEPPFNPAEGERLSVRRNAEQADIDAAQAGAPSMRATPAGPQARATGEGMMGRAGDLIKSQTYSAASGFGRHLADAASAVGAEDLSANLGARASAASEKSRQLNQGVELERAARRFETVAGFAPGSVVQDANRFADQYLPQILAQSQQVPMALFGGLTPLVGMSYLSSYADARDAGKSPAEALAYAVPQATAEYVGEKVGGMGRLNAAFEKAVSTGFARDAAWRNLGKAFLAAGAKEVPSEELTFGLQFINDKFSPAGLQPNATWEDFKRGAADTAIVAMGSGGMMAGAGAMIAGRPQGRDTGPNAEQMARAKGFLLPDQKPADDPRVQRLRDAGEKDAADLLEKRLAAQRLPAEVDRELTSLQLPAAQAPEFQDTYRSLRTAGVKPAEAAARTAVVTDFRAAAAAAGMSDKAIAAALDAGQKKGLADLPTFLHRYTQSLASRGAVQAVDIGPQLEAARDAGLEAATESLYGDVQQAMEAAQVLEGQQDGQAPATPAAAPAPAFETGNDIALTPEADAAHAAATSPLNDLTEPSQAQKEAGNYKVGRLRIAGMDISVENPQGSTRSGTDPDGKAWETPMRHHYGYFRGTTAADGDKLDVFVQPGTAEDYRGPVFVIDQIDPKTGTLDEHKVILGARDEAEAEQIYRSNYSADWQGLGAITRLPLPAFKAWAATGNKKEALGDITRQTQEAGPPQEAAGTKTTVTTDEAAAAGTGTDGRNDGAVQPDRAVDAVAVAEQPAAVNPKPNARQVALDAEKARVDEQRARRSAAAKEAAKPMEGLSVGSLPTNAEAVSVKDGVVYVGKYPAQNFDTGADVTVPAGATPQQIAAALKASGALGKRAKFFGLAETPAQPATEPMESLGKTGDRSKAGDRARSRAYEANPFKSFIAKHGISSALASEFAPGQKERQAALVQGYGPVFRKSGLQLDALAELAVQDGYLTTPDVTRLSAMIGDVLRGKRIIPQYADGAAETEMEARAALEKEAGEEQNAELEAETQAERDAIQAVAALSDESLLALAADDAVLTASNNVSEADFLRALGATEQEIQDATQGQGRKGQGSGSRPGPQEAAAGAAPRGAESRDGQARADGEGLTAPTRADIEAQQERAETAPARDQREQVRRESEAGSGLFELTAQDGRQDTTGSLFDQPAERFEIGKSITKEQRKQVLSTLIDVYKAKGAPREQKGVGRDGNERSGYAYSPDLFEKSDITGAMVRYYVTLPDGRIAHPSELFPDLSTADVESMAAEQAREQEKAAAYENAIKPFYSDYADAELRAGKDQTVISKGDQFAVIPDSWGAVKQAESNGWQVSQRPAAEKPISQMSAADLLRAAADKMEGKAETIQDLGEKIGGARKDTAQPTGRAPRKSAETDNRPAWARRFQISEIVAGNDEGRWVIRDTRALDWRKQPKQVGRETFASREAAERALPLLAVAQKHRVVPVNVAGGTQTWEIWRDISDRKRVKVVDLQFASRDDAMRYMAENATTIIEANTTFGEADLPVPEDKQRVGAERRQGDVKGEDFRSAFGFRGVEFGNWNNQTERQELMNEAYDGLMDLAEVMGVPPKAISLNGDLALAFGARGHGLSGARAHYEPDRAVMNLTKMKGAGALAHEWFHAMDHYFGRQDGKAPVTWVTNTDGTRSLKTNSDFQDNAVTSGFSRQNSGVRQEVREAYQAVMETMMRKAEKYVQDTARVEQFVATVRDGVESRLAGIRRDLAEQKDVRYYKRNNKPATAEQLAAFDDVARQIIEGTALETELRPSGTKSLTGMRWSNDHLEKLSAIYKAVRGRSGFDADQNGTLDRLRQEMGLYSARLKMLAEAQSGEEKTKKVPTDFAMDAKSLDQGRGTDYWITPHEMAARAFQGYVEDKIAERGGKSPFLNYGPEDAGILTPWGAKRPYPAGAERKAINTAFDKLVDVIETRETEQGMAMYARAYHGSPYKFDKFTLDNIGKGEGAQAFGWGLYFAGKKEVADFYRRKLTAADGKPVRIDNTSMIPVQRELSLGDAMDRVAKKIAALRSNIESAKENPDAFAPDAIQRLQADLDAQIAKQKELGKRGELYEVEIPDESEMLLWDKPLSEQPEKVRAALISLGEVKNYSGQNLLEMDPAGETIYKAMERGAGDAETVSKRLNGMGVAGIKYLDGESRNRPLGEIKREFLAELPEDADFEEVMDLIGTGTFSPSNESILKELAANDWLGFDYPAQAISAALGNRLADFDPSPALVQAVASAQDGSTYNYVVFDDSSIRIMDAVQEEMAADITMARGMDAAAFRRAFGAPEPMDVSRAQEIVDKLTAGWKNGPAFKVVATAQDLPGGNHPSDARGLIQNGTAYVVAANNPTRDAVARTLGHEAIGHYGLWKMLGEDGTRQFQRNLQLAVKTGNKPLNAIRDKVRRLYVDDRGRFNLTPAQEADEIAAFAVEQAIDPMTGEFRPGFGFLKSVWAKIADFLRGLGLKVRFTNAELQGMLVQSMQGLQAGQRLDGGIDDMVVAAARQDQPVQVPDVIVGNPLGSATGHPDYAAAKAGDVQAAVKVARTLVDKGLVDKVRAAIGDSKPVIVPVVAEEAAGRNKIPLAAAEALANRLGLETETVIGQANQPHRTGMDGLDRLFAVPEFRGPVEPGREYLLVDDTLTQGATFAALASHIQQGGGRVVGAVALTGKQYSATIQPSAKTLEQLRGKHGDIENDFRAATGYGFDALTQSEARYLANYEPAQRLRVRIVDEGRRAREGRDPQAAGSLSRGGNDGRNRGADGSSAPSQPGGVGQQDVHSTVGGKPPAQGWAGATRVSRAGSPLTVYRGAASPLKAGDFGLGSLGKASGNPSSGLGVWFTTGQKEAGGYGAVEPMQLDIRNPKVLRFDQLPGFDSVEEAHAWREKLRSQGHDGVFLHGKGLGKEEIHIIAFSPEQAVYPGEQGALARGRSNKKDYTDLEQEALERAGIRGKRTVREAVRSGFDRATQLLLDRGELWSVFRQGNLDQFHGIDRAVKAELGGLPTDQDPYVAARLANGGTSGVMRAILLHGQAKWAANGQHLEKVPGTKGLLDILAPLGDDLNDWFGWMVGNRAAILKAGGRENNLTDAQIKALQGLAKDKKDLFRKVATEYAEFKRSVLDVAEQAGLIDPDGRKAWDFADYIPFYRQIDSKASFSATGRKGLAGQSSGIRVLKGGESALNDPMENLLMNFSRLIDASLKNNAISKTVAVLKMTDRIKKVGYDMAGVVVPKDQVRKVLIEAGTPEALLGAMPDSAFNGMAKMWSVQAPSDPDVVRVMVGGKPQFYRVEDPLLLKALTSFVPFDFPGLFLARGAKRILTRMVTSTPDFMLRNFIRDSAAAQGITRHGFNPAKSLHGILKSYTESGAFEPMLFAGASFQAGNVNAADPTGTAQAMRRSLRAKGLSAASADSFLGSVMDSGLRGVEHYFEVSEAIENSNREAVYEATLKDTGNATTAAYEAKDLMDFSLRGSSAIYQLMADVLPFFNARVQGMYRLGRADPKRLLTIGTLMMVASLLLAMANDGEDWYEELEDWDKDTYWHFKIGGKHFRLPKPFELGVVFATFPERIGRAIKGLDSRGKTADRAWANVRDQLSIDPVPQLIKPLLEVWANKDRFRDRPIETLADEGKLPSARFNANTSDTARVASQAMAPVSDTMGLSPKALQHMVNGYLGTVGTYALGLSDMLVRKLEGQATRPELRLDDLPVLKSFYREDPARATIYESELYKMRDEVTKISNTIRAYRKAEDDASADALEQREDKKLDVKRDLDKAAKQIADLRKDRDVIMRDRTMTPKEKRRAIDELQLEQNEIAREVMRDPAIKAAR